MKQFEVDIWKPESIQTQFRKHMEYEYSDFWSRLVGNRVNVGSDSFQAALFVSETVKRERQILENSINEFAYENRTAIQRSIEQSTQMICTTLNKGFEQMGNKLDDINYSLELVNDNLSLIYEEQVKTNLYLANIQGLLRNQTILLTIPDIEKKKAHNVSEGLRYLSATNTWDSLNFDRALEFFTKALKINQYDFLILEKLGFIHLYSKNLADYNRSVQYYREAINEMDVIIQTKQVPRNYYLLKDGSKNFDTNVSILEITKLLINSLLGFSKSNYLLGNFSDSVSYTKRAYQLSNSNPAIGFQLCIYLVANNSTNEAIQLLKKLIAQDNYILVKIVNTLELISQKEVFDLLQSMYENEKQAAKDLFLTQSTPKNGEKPIDAHISVVSNILSKAQKMIKNDNYFDYLNAQNILRTKYTHNIEGKEYTQNINELLAIESGMKKYSKVIDDFTKERTKHKDKVSNLSNIYYDSKQEKEDYDENKRKIYFGIGGSIILLLLCLTKTIFFFKNDSETIFNGMSIVATIVGLVIIVALSYGFNIIRNKTVEYINDIKGSKHKDYTKIDKQIADLYEKLSSVVKSKILAYHSFSDIDNNIEKSKKEISLLLSNGVNLSNTDIKGIYNNYSFLSNGAIILGFILTLGVSLYLIDSFLIKSYCVVKVMGVDLPGGFFSNSTQRCGEIEKMKEGTATFRSIDENNVGVVTVKVNSNHRAVFEISRKQGRKYYYSHDVEVRLEEGGIVQTSLCNNR